MNAAVAPGRSPPGTSPAGASILPGASAASGQQSTLGVMGGGQLGRMFVQAAQAMGYFTAVLDPDVVSPAGLVSHYHIQTDYLDEQGLAQLMQRCAAITTEFENVPAPALKTLGAHRPVAPGADAVAIAQDRARERPRQPRRDPRPAVRRLPAPLRRAARGRAGSPGERPARRAGRLPPEACRARR